MTWLQGFGGPGGYLGTASLLERLGGRIHMACVRILIADDHELIRQGLRALLAARPAWEAS